MKYRCPYCGGWRRDPGRQFHGFSHGFGPGFGHGFGHFGHGFGHYGFFPGYGFAIGLPYFYHDWDWDWD